MPPHGRGTPPADKFALERGPEVAKTVSEELDPEDPFNQLIGILCNVRVDWEIKRRTLSKIGKLVDVLVDGKLPEKVADCITNPDENRKQEVELRQLQEEVNMLKVEIFTLREDMATTREMADETQKVMTLVKATFEEIGTAVAKAKLFDEGVLKEKKLSGSRMVRILTDFAEQMDAAMVGA